MDLPRVQQKDTFRRDSQLCRHGERICDSVVYCPNAGFPRKNIDENPKMQEPVLIGNVFAPRRHGAFLISRFPHVALRFLFPVS